MRNTRFLAAMLFATSSLVLLTAQTNTHTAPTSAQIVTRIVTRLTTLLNLSADQQTKATAIFTNEQTTTATVRTTMAADHTALQTAIEKDDTESIATVSTQIGTLTAQVTQAHATAQAEFYALLTSEQQTKYQQLLETPGGFGGGPGGHGGPDGAGFHGHSDY